MSNAVSNSTNAIWVLSGQGGDGTTRREPVQTFPFTVGRGQTATFCLPFPAVSSLHAELFLRDDQLWIRDSNSTNGTFVDGRQLKGETPLTDGSLVQFANLVFRVEKQIVNIRTATASENYCDQALAVLQFDKLMREQAVQAYFQPIVRNGSRELYGYEMLGRSGLFGLRRPVDMFGAAAQLRLEADLSRLFRVKGMEAATQLTDAPKIFLNTHPTELSQPQKLVASLYQLRSQHPTHPIVLEIHESAVTDPKAMVELRAALRDLAIGLSYDDFGAGQARLLELCDVPPDVLKFDMSLVRGVANASEERKKMLGMFVRMAIEIGVTPLAECIEDEEDHQVCEALGFELFQGYLYGRPAPVENWLGVDVRNASQSVSPTPGPEQSSTVC